MLQRHAPGSTKRLTLGADKACDARDFVRELRQACSAGEPSGAAALTGY